MLGSLNLLSSPGTRCVYVLLLGMDTMKYFIHIIYICVYLAYFIEIPHSQMRLVLLLAGTKNERKKSK